jgi:hypothetical protein
LNTVRLLVGALAERSAELGEGVLRDGTRFEDLDDLPGFSEEGR